MEDMKMAGSQGADLVQVWISVSDPDGSTRLESRWASVEQAIAAHPTYAA